MHVRLLSLTPRLGLLLLLLAWLAGCAVAPPTPRPSPAPEPVGLEPLPDDVAFRTQQVALLLPLSGRLSAAGEAVLEGVSAAHFSLPPDQRGELRIYDTGERPEAAWQQYQQAVADGATLVLGPLDRAAVDNLTRRDSLSVPVIALNRSTLPGPYPRGLHQFALSPEDEASQVALRAAQQGLFDAVIMAPRDELGERIVDAFSARYRQLGGTIRDVQFYVPGGVDFRDTIVSGLEVIDPLPTHRQRADAHRMEPEEREALVARLDWMSIALDEHWMDNPNVIRLMRGGITAEELSEQLMSAVTEPEVEAQMQRLERLDNPPPRRQDVDMVFLVGDARQARLIRPQLRYYHAGNLPVLSTSQVFSGRADARADADLDDIIFADMPWLVDPNQAARLDWLEDLSAGAQQRRRLVGLGHDALMLGWEIDRLNLHAEQSFAGLTGRLCLDDQGWIRRELSFGQFRRGVPQPARIPPQGFYQPFDAQP